MPDTTIPVPSHLRERIALVALPVFLTGLLGLFIFTAYIERLIPVDPARAEAYLIDALHFLSIFTLLIMTSLVGGIGSILLKTLKADQYPPPDVQFPWAAKLRTGTAATRPALCGLVFLAVFRGLAQELC
jgi:hypothetical protein